MRSDSYPMVTPRFAQLHGFFWALRCNTEKPCIPLREYQNHEIDHNYTNLEINVNTLNYFIFLTSR